MLVSTFFHLRNSHIRNLFYHNKNTLLTHSIKNIGILYIPTVFFSFFSATWFILFYFFICQLLMLFHTCASSKKRSTSSKYIMLILNASIIYQIWCISHNAASVTYYIWYIIEALWIISRAFLNAVFCTLSGEDF